MMLAEACRVALSELSKVGTEGEVAMRGREGEHLLWLGLGWAVARGYATYAGDGHFKSTPRGLRAKAELDEEEAECGFLVRHGD